MCTPYAHRSALVVILLCTLGCATGGTLNVPAADSTPPAAVLDVNFPQSGIFTVTAAGHNPAMPIQLGGNEDLDLVALCKDEDGGCRNIEIFVDASTNNADGSVAAVALTKPLAESLDPSAAPGGSASAKRNASTRLSVPQLRGSTAGLRLDLSAKATNAHQATDTTKPVSLFWSRQAPLTLPPCPRFGPVGSAPPVVLDSRAVTVGLQNAKAKDPNKTTFLIGVTDGQPNPTTAWRLTIEEVGLPPTRAIFRLEDTTGSAKEALTVDSRNCNAAGKLLQASGNSSSADVLVTSADTTTLLLSRPNMGDVAVWNEATFWPAFGGKKTTVTWIGQ